MSEFERAVIERLDAILGEMKTAREERAAGEDWDGVSRADKARQARAERYLSPPSCPSVEEKQELLKSLHTCNGSFGGEPCSPCNLERFILAE